jgi:hypothetical protein
LWGGGKGRESKGREKVGWERDVPQVFSGAISRSKQVKYIHPTRDASEKVTT